MKKILHSLVLCALVTAVTGKAAVSVSTSTNSISADTAQNASSGSFTTIGNIVITEGAASDFGTGTSVTLILTAPTGWRFGGTPTLSQNTGQKDITLGGVVATNSTVTATFTVGGTTKSDTLTISGVQVQPTNGASLPSSGLILRTAANPGTATINGIVNGTTSFGSLSQTMGAASKLTISTQPSTTATAGTAFATQPVVRIEDQFGTLRSSDTLTVTAARNAGSGTLQGTTSVNAVGGIATYSGLSHTVATNITITFSSGALATATSGSIAVSPTTATKLVFTTDPAGAVVGSAFSTQPVVRSQDTFGNNSTVGLANSKTISVSLTTGSGLSGTTTANIGLVNGNGVATFTDLRIDTASASNQLTASSTGFTSGTSAIFAVAKGNQTITFGALANRTYGDASFAVTATASSGLPVSFSIVSGPATISTNNQISITGVGTVTVRASQAGDSNYNAAANVDQSFTVSKATLTVTANNKTRGYGDANPTLTASYSGFVNGDTSAVLTGAPALSTTAVASSTVSGSPYTITAAVGTLSSTNYTFSFVNGQLTVTQAALTVTADNTSRVYGSSNPTFTGNISGIKNSDNITASYSTTATAASGVGPYAIVPSLIDPTSKLSNYTVTTNNGTLNVTAASLTVTAANKSRNYGAPNPAFTGSISGLQNSDDITATYSTTATATSGVGSYAITPTLIDPGSKLGNYTVTTNNGTLTIDAAALTVTANDKSRAYGAANPTLTVSYSGFVNSEDATVLGGTLSVTTTATTSSTVGGYAITASGLTATNYTISYQAGTLTVTPAALTVVANNASRTYGSANPALTGSLTGVQNSDNITATYQTTATPTTGVGTVAITPVLADPSNKLTNYTVFSTNGVLTISRAELTVTAVNKSRQYGQSNPTFTAAFSGFVNSEDESVISGAAAFNTSADATSSVAGSPYTIVISAGTLSAANYSFTFVNGSLSVTRAPLTGTADNKSRAYGQANPAFTATYTGFVNDEDSSVVSGTLLGSTTATATSAVGTYPITVSGQTAANYSISYVDGTLTVTPYALSVVADAATRVYGATNPAFTGVISGIQNGDDITATYATSADATSSVGTYAIVPTLVDPSNKLTNYTVLSTNGVLTVTRAVLTVTADDKARLYGSANPSFTATVTGFVNSEDASVISGTADVSTVADATSSVAGSPYSIVPTIGTLSATNYTFTFVNGNLTVNRAPLTGKADDKSRVYGQTDPTFTATYTGFVNSEDASVVSGTLVGGSTAVASSPVGTYPITVSGQTAANYSISYEGGTLTITPASLSVVANNAIRVYGATNPIFTGVVTGVVNDDGITATYATTATASSGVASYAITPTLVDPNAKLTNYTVASTNGVLTITPAVITVTADNKARAYGSANPTFTATLSGFVNGEDSSVVSGSADFSTVADASSSVAGSPYAIVPTIGTLAASNYTFSFANGELTVNRAALTGKADDKSRAYGQANPSFTATYSGFVNDETASVVSGTLTGSTTADEQSPIGTYTISVGGQTAANYSITYEDGTLTVTPYALTVVADNASRAYGATNPVFTGTLVGVQNSDGITATFETTNVTALSVPGTYSIVPVLHDPASKLTNYTVLSTNGTLTITRALLTVTADNQSRVYGSANPTLTYQISGFVNGETADVVSGEAELATAGASAGVGSHSITVAAGTLAASNYDFSFVDGTLTVTAKSLTGQVNNASRVYGDANPAFSVSYSGFVNSDDTSVLSGTLSFNTAATPSSPIGSYSVSASGQSASNYAITYVDGTLQVTVATITVVADNASRTYGDNNPTFTGTLSGVRNSDDITATYGSTASAASSVGTFAITPVLVDPTAKLTNYVVLSTNGVLTVTKATLTVTANDESKVYGSANPTFSATYSGFRNTDSSTVLSGAPTFAVSPSGSAVGSYTIQVSAGTLAATNYDFAFVDGTLAITPATLTVTADNKSRAYGEANPTFTATYNGFVNGDTTNDLTGSLAFSTSATTFSASGTYAISVSGQTSSNYAITYVDGSLTIGKAVLTATANDVSRSYGETNPVFTGIVSANGDSITATFTSAATTNSPVGTYSILPTFNDPNGKLTNYTIESSGTLTVTNAVLTVSADEVSRAYGDANPTFTGSVSGIKNGENIVAVFSSDATATSSVGTYTLHAEVYATNGVGDLDLAILGNYVIVTNGSLTITNAPLVVTVNDAVKGYGSPNPAFYGSITGIKNGENITATYSSSATDSSAKGTYAITATLSDNGTGVLTNYGVTIVPGTLTIGGSVITVIADSTNRVYGAANPSFTGIISGIVTGDNVTVSYTTSASETSAVGTYTITPVLSDNGTGALTNYAIQLTNGTLTITKAALVVTPNAAGVGPGTNTPAFTSTITGLQNGEQATVTYSLSPARLSKATIANYKITTTSAVVTNSNGDVTTGNYNVTLGTNTFSVLAPVKMAAQPTVKPAATVQQGKMVTFSVAAVTGATPSYQWALNGIDIAGATKSAYTNLTATFADAGVYTVTVSNAAAVVTSTNNLTLTVVADTNAPVAVTAKPAAMYVTSETTNVSGVITASGTATDNARVTAIYYRLNGGSWSPIATFAPKDASGLLINWTNSLAPATGTNILEVYAQDWTGNTSKVAKTTFFFHVPRTLTVSIDEHDTRAGEGPADYAGTKSTIAPDFVTPTNGATLYVNRGPYKLTAKPGHNQTFTNWTQIVDGVTNVVSTNAVYQFKMETNLTLVANFIHNPYMEAQGSYYGLFTNGYSDYDISGYVGFKVMTNQSFSSTFIIDGVTFAPAGKLNVDGSAHIVINRARYNKASLTVDIQTLFGSNGSSGTNQIVGTITDGTKSAHIIADQWIYNGALTNDQYGKYTMILPGSNDASTSPAGHSFAAVTVATNGNVSGSGNLADSTVLVPKITPVTKDGRWPFYQQLYIAPKVRAMNYTNNSVLYTNAVWLGSLMGWLQFTNNEAIGGTVYWVKNGTNSDILVGPAGVYSNYYAFGFTNVMEVLARKYVQPTDPTNLRLIQVTNALVSFKDGNIPGVQTHPIYIKTNNLIKFITNVINGTNALGVKSTNTQLGNLTVTFIPLSGKMTGTFTNAMSQTALGAAKSLLWNGIVVQPYNVGYGYFIGTNQSGSMTIEQDPGNFRP